MGFIQQPLNDEDNEKINMTPKKLLNHKGNQLMSLVQKQKNLY